MFINCDPTSLYCFDAMAPKKDARQSKPRPHEQASANDSAQTVSEPDVDEPGAKKQKLAKETEQNRRRYCFELGQLGKCCFICRIKGSGEASLDSPVYEKMKMKMKNEILNRHGFVIDLSVPCWGEGRSIARVVLFGRGRVRLAMKFDFRCMRLRAVGGWGRFGKQA